MSVLSSLASRSRNEVVWATVTSVFAGVAGAGLVMLINRALGVAPSALPNLGFVFVAIATFMLVCRWVSQRLFVRLGQAATAHLRKQIGERLSAAPFREVEREGSARATAVLVEDVAAVSDFFVALPRLAMQGAVVVSCLVYLCVLSWQAFAFALAMIVVGSLMHGWAVGKAGGDLEQARTDEDELYEHFRALFSGAKELRLHGQRRYAFISRVLKSCVQRVRTRRTRGLLIFVAAGSWGSFLFFAVIGGVIFGLGSVFEIAPAVRAGYALIFLYMIHPMEGMLEAIPELQRAQLGQKRIDALTTGASDIELDPSFRPVPLQAVGLRAATHRYRHDAQDGEFALGPIDLELRPAEVVFLVGGNGSGKTSLAKLLVGLYEPEGGELTWNGAPVERSAREAYRQNFSAVFSDFHLFDSVLGVGARDLDARAFDLLQALELDHKVTVKDGRFSTTELSRGQQKRLALLVSFLEDRPVYVFDEWAADQEPLFREAFYRKLLPELKVRGKAVLVITHDDRYFHLADRQLRLEAGRLTEHGAAA